MTKKETIQAAIDVIKTEFGTCPVYKLGCIDCVATRLKEDLEEMKELLADE